MHYFLWNDPALEHTCFVDLKKQKDVSFLSVEYFTSRFPEHCPPAGHTNEPYDEFCVYQSLPAIPPDKHGNIKSNQSDAVEEEEECRIRVDVLMHELEKQRDRECQKKVGLLALIAKLVLTLPHSNYSY